MCLLALQGAVVHLDRECKPSFMVFESVPHPPVRPMAYASGMSMFGV
jgi:serine/threonine-protein phosphatase 5